MTAKIWTIGYEYVGLPDFVAALQAADVELLVDVREIANSRRAGFAKKALSGALDEAGIAYVHMKAIGTPKAGRDAAHKGDVATMHAIYEQKLEMPEAQLALRELVDMAQSQRACLMCLEHDWRGCHRSLITDALATFDIEPVHLDATHPGTVFS